MKCVIPGPNVKILGRAIHSLAKLGDELYIEATENDLFFRTVNSSKTAYASFCFSSDFFLFFQTERRYDSLTCQISMRSALNVFKSPMSLEKITESIQIQFLPDSDNVIFIIKYKKGVNKTFNIPVIECEALQAYYMKESTPNSITIQPKIVGEILNNFQNHHDEITWKVTKNQIIIKNFSEVENECNGIRTEICVYKDEFDNYKIENETEVTFCLKELRAVLLFSDSVSLPLTANFSVCSKPIVFVIKDDVFEVNIVVSTLSGDENSSLDNLSVPTTENSDNTQNKIETNFETNNETNQFFLNGDHVEMPNIESSENISNNDRLNNIFKECFEKEEHYVENLPGYNVILVPESDSDS